MPAKVIRNFMRQVHSIQKDRGERLWSLGKEDRGDPKRGGNPLRSEEAVRFQCGYMAKRSWASQQDLRIAELKGGDRVMDRPEGLAQARRVGAPVKNSKQGQPKNPRTADLGFARTNCTWEQPENPGNHKTNL